MARFFPFLCCSVTEPKHEEDVEEVFDDFLFRGGHRRFDEFASLSENSWCRKHALVIAGSPVTSITLADDLDSSWASTDKKALMWTNSCRLASDPRDCPPLAMREHSTLSAAFDRFELLEAAHLANGKADEMPHLAILGTGGVTRLRTVAALYEASLQKINIVPSSMPVFGALPDYDFEYGLELQSHSFMLVVTVTWHLGSMDELLRYAALYISKDCSPGWDSTVHKVEPLGQQAAAEAVWRVHGVDGVGVKTDDVLRRNWLIPEKRSAYDAWVVEASATDEDQPFGASLPPVEDGHVRASDVLKFTALTGDRGEGGVGFTLKVRHVLTVSPGSLSMALMRFMPKWALRKALGSALERAVRMTPEHVEKNCRPLGDIVQKGPAAQFYAALSSRILHKS
ncbi:unnamed protein product [Symbiodinium necroappetens]|uniref:START domain-containing protein n=1 Tax=Symbiodinium necroappetens TaxID=1628268 RepID=A0A812ZXS4_9DINO|nr:unnamed protein product [Symbiodinium necroappetens]